MKQAFLQFQKTHKTGFTIVELSLSIAFIAILSIAVTLIIVNSISSYRRGITLNQLNTVGMDLVDDLRASVQGSPARSVTDECANVYKTEDRRKACENDGARKFVTVSFNTKVKIGQTERTNTPVFGAFCSGDYSYIWNSGYFFNDDYQVNNGATEKASLVYRLAGSGEVKTASNFKLLKVKDEARSVCISAITAGQGSNPNYNSSRQINDASSKFDISSDNYNVVDTEPIDILDSTGNLAIYNLDSIAPAIGVLNKKLFYNVSFILGTVQGGIDIKAQGGYCAPPEGYNSGVENFDYCAINKFNFAAQTTGG